MKTVFYCFAIFQIFFSHPTVIFALDATSSASTYASAGISSQIEKYLCAPTDSGGGTTNVNSLDLYKCINRLYRFFIALASVIAVFFMVIAGYIYMSADGSSEATDKAKSILVSSITALVILFVGYNLLRAINPDLIKFQKIQPPSVGAIPDAEKPKFGFEQTTDSKPGAIAPTGNADSLAKQILSNSSITLATSHVSGVSDNANAKQNIIDTSAGKAVTRSSYTHEGRKGPGGTVAIDEGVLKAILAVSAQYKVRISEIAGGVHAEKSDHYSGRAFDIDLINNNRVSASNPDTQKVMSLCTQNGGKAIGPPTAGHETHIHCSYAK